MDLKQLIGQAQLLLVEGKEKESIKLFEKALEAGADAFMVHLSIGVAYMKLKEIDKAIENFGKAIQANDNNPRSYYYRGLAFIAREEYEKATTDLSRALEIKKDLHTARFARATAYTRMEKFEEASKDLKAVLPQMAYNLQGFADTYGIIRTELHKVIAQLSDERESAGLKLSEEEIETLKKWLGEE